jgi:hypothetical protein
MQSLRKYFSNAVLISIIFTAVAYSQEPLPQPEFSKVNFLRSQKCRQERVPDGARKGNVMLTEHILVHINH